MFRPLRLAAVALAAPVLAAPVLTLGAAQPASAQDADPFARFAESTPSSHAKIDYSVWTSLLRDIVFNVGPSDRAPALGRPVMTGTRIFEGHRGRYRYEGNRILYHVMSDEYLEALTVYREDLESLPDRIDLASLNANEQLAYWLNLHNVALIEQIALQYPVKHIDHAHALHSRAPLFDAKILTVAGAPMSLNDIREKIVYANWDDPLVIYGFFRGAVGGPNVRTSAYDGDRVWGQLEANGYEFVNSLRGVDGGVRAGKVSWIYDEARPWFFPDWPTDLRAHLETLAQPDTLAALHAAAALDADVEDWAVADLVNGSTDCSASAMYSFGREGLSAVQSCAIMPEHAKIFVNHIQERQLRLYREGRLGEVVIRDRDTPDDQPPPDGQ